MAVRSVDRGLVSGGGEEEHVVVERMVGRVVSKLVAFQEPLDVAVVLVPSSCELVLAPETPADAMGLKDRGVALPRGEELGLLKFLERGIVVAEGAVVYGHKSRRERGP